MTPAEAIAVVREALDALAEAAQGWNEDNPYERAEKAARPALALIEQRIEQAEREGFGTGERSQWGVNPTWKARAEAAEARIAQLEEALRRIGAAVEAWDNDETPDEDFPFAADMDFVNFCGHIARAALASGKDKP